MQEMLDKRQERGDINDFYSMMSQLYGRGPDDERHASPTKRLISLKNSTADHKQIMSSNIQRT